MDIETIIREHIDASVHMSLATSENNIPWICEVHIVHDDDLTIYWRSLPSRRHSKEIEQNHAVAGNVVKQHEVNELVVGVYFEGSAEMLSEGVEEQKAAELYAERFGSDIGELLSEAREEAGHKFYKLTVGTFYAFGRFGADHGQKLALKWND